MKRMNVLDDRQVKLGEKIICSIGDRLVKMAVNPRFPCPPGMIYEPELSEDMIKDMLLNQ